MKAVQNDVPVQIGFIAAHLRFVVQDYFYFYFFYNFSSAFV